MKFFRPSVRDIWEQFSREINGELSSGGLSVFKKFKSYTMELTTQSGRNSPVYTIISCILPNKHNLRFKFIGDYYERYIFNYNKLMDYVITNNDLKSKYIIRSNSRLVIDQILTEPEVVKCLVENRDMFIELRPTNMMESDDPSSNSIFRLSILGTVMDNSLLRDLFELTANFISVIDTINSTVENPLVVKDPNIIEVLKSSAKNLYVNSEKLNSLTNKFIGMIHTKDENNLSSSQKEILTHVNVITRDNNLDITPTDSSESSETKQEIESDVTNITESKSDTFSSSVNTNDLTISTDDLQITTDDLKIPSVSIDE